MQDDRAEGGAHHHGLLERSPFESDAGALIGRNPRGLTRADFEAAGVPLLPVMKAVRANCVDCVGGQVGEVRKCVHYRCPFWPMRMGNYPSQLRAAASAPAMASAEENDT